MIELTVRTLDSQNHSFTVNDDITVSQFKQHIADTVNIPAETQRIIYCGRVLTDESKLNEFDVNGKVVHLVERAPPTENQRGNGNRSHSPQPQQRVIGSNAMYLGSMAIPLEPQNLVPPPPSHSLAASRLNVARRMLRRAEGIINILENPTARPTDTTPAEEPQEEVTPVFEARVIVPTSSNEPIDEAFIFNSVQNSIINATTSMPGRSAPQQQPQPVASSSPERETSSTIETDTPPARSASSTPEGVSPISTSTEDLASESRNTNPPEGGNTLAENASRTSEMADLLETLCRLQIRFAPFLERYQNFMREDPVVEQEDTRRTQAMMNRVSEVLHYLGHAYHSLSDIIIRVRNAPSRPLLCRPILIQHSAVLQAGFPIQVEAQINFAPDNAAPNNSTTPTTTANESTNNQSIPTTNSSSGRMGPNITMNPNLLSFPLMPPSGVHVQSFPIGIRTLRPGSGNRPSTTTSATNNAPGSNPPTNQSGNSNTNNSGGFNNPNLEFFMEVTPESITIDSLETTLLGGSQGEGMRGGAPPPELIQSIVQMASHLVNRGASTSNINLQNATQPPPNASTQATESSTQPSANNVNPGHNSQARGNTQTNPTTATHTRSTPRPHVHLAQHAMQGFDPFLPCNSHHVGTRRRPTRNTANSNQSTNNNRAQNGNSNNNPFNPVYNIVQGVLNSIQNIYGRRSTPQAQAPTTQPAAPTSTTPTAPPMVDLNQLFSSMPNFANILPHLQNINNIDVSARGPTIAQLLQQAGDQSEGEGIFNDLIMLLSRNFTISDMLQLNSGRLDPLMRVRNELRTFIVDRVLEGNPTSTNVERGVNRLMSEIQPFIENLSHLQVRDNIDIVRSTQMLFRTRLPNIINLAASRVPNSIKMLVEQLRITSRHLCGLILHASSNGQRGVEEVLSHIVTRYMDGIAPDIQQWTLLATRAQLQQFMRSLNIPPSVLQPYIVRNVDSVTTAENSEPMELDTQSINDVESEQASGSTSVLGVINLEGSNDLPTVVLGSESWHGQVPTDWVPIITRDTQRQRRQNQQSALSDAYLSGMPSKRRKIVTNSKPQGSLPQVISESIRRAVTATGLSSVGNLETVSQEAAADLNIQSAYRDLLRSRVQSSIQDNEDFTPDRFPNASNYFNKSQ